MSHALVFFADQLPDASAAWHDREVYLSLGGDYKSVGLTARVEIITETDGQVAEVICHVDPEDYDRAVANWGDEAAVSGLRTALTEQLA